MMTKERPSERRRVDALGHRLESVDIESGVGLVEHAELGLEHRHLEDLVALLLASGEAFIDGTIEELLVQLDHLGLLLQELEEVDGSHLLFATLGADGVQRRAKEVAVVDARDLDRVLEGEEDALAGTLFRLVVEEVLSLKQDLAAGDLVAVASREDVGERALAGAVAAHDGVHFAGLHVEVQALQNGLAAHRCLKFLDLEHDLLPLSVFVDWLMREDAKGRQPTLPSRLTSRSFLASTANSIGSSRKTSLQKPLTIMLTASSSAMPRCLQ